MSSQSMDFKSWLDQKDADYDTLDFYQKNLVKEWFAKENSDREFLQSEFNNEISLIIMTQSEYHDIFDNITMTEIVKLRKSSFKGAEYVRSQLARFRVKRENFGELFSNRFYKTLQYERLFLMDVIHVCNYIMENK